MSEMMYTRCELCKGTGLLDQPAVTNTGRTEHRCPCKGAQFPGWAPVGVTVGQLDRIVTENARLKGQPTPPAEPRCPTCSLFLERRVTHTGVVWQCPTPRCGLEAVPDLVHPSDYLDDRR